MRPVKLFRFVISVCSVGMARERWTSSPAVFLTGAPVPERVGGVTRCD